jgi:RecB family exonuclease
MKRVFLGWNRPGPIAAVEWLVDRFGRPAALDLSEAVVVVPAARAGRRLIELLLDAADQRGWAFTPPDVVTLGRLPELLYVNRRPLAEGLATRLAWIEALRRAGTEGLQRLTPLVPEGDLSGWLSLAEMLDRLHTEVAAEDLNFADVATRGASLPEFREAERWRVLADVQAKYLEVLDEAQAWDKQTARRVAVQHCEAHTQKEIYLLATADMTRVHRLLLEQVGDRVTALVVAPEEMAERFDPLGCIRPEAWQEARIDLKSEAIVTAEGPADQAACVVRTIAAWDGRYSGDEITVGVPDASIVPSLAQYLEQAEVPARYAGGTPLDRAPPCRLIAAVADYLEERRFSTFAALLRHPAVHEWLVRRGFHGDWLSGLDDYYCRHLPFKIGDVWLGDPEDCRLVRQVHAAIEGLVKPLSNGKRPLERWLQPLLELLVTLFGTEPLDRGVEPDRTILAACEAIHRAVEEYRRIPPSLAPEIGGPEALRLVLREVYAEAVPFPAMPGAVELVGWLELLLDDAPALIVTGFNEGIVPGSTSGDLFLPSVLRQALAIEDNDRRYARDAYALSVLAASREQFTLIVGRRSADGEPLAPSRLLFACEREMLAKRALALFRPEARPAAPALGRGLRAGCTQARFEVPRPKPLAQPINSMRVTEFRDYLACPYRYYLRHCLRLKLREDVGDELDEGMFGSLAHAVLGEFGQGEMACSTDGERIEAYLNALLDRLVVQSHGKSPLSAIRVQVEQLRLRLRAFARWQAAWARQGWRIEHAEIGAKDRETALVVDQEPMGLRGRIDRIDVHQGTGQRAIFDYKTSDNRKDPDHAHRRKDEWVDLQLPLYRHLAVALDITGPVRLGYIVLPKDTSKTGEVWAEWSETELREADAVAEKVVRGVRGEVFWPATAPAPDFFDEFAAICLEGRFFGSGRLADEEPQP